jgi:hypothetical protein
MTEKIDYKKTAFILTAGEPMDFKAFPDGSLVVIAHDGKKHRFTAEQVQEVQPKPDPKPKPAPKRSRPSKTESKIVKGD